MKPRSLIIITLLMLLTNFLSAIEITYEGKVGLTQKEGFFIGFPRGFVVTEDDFIVVCDIRASDFKIFNQEGKALSVFGRKGYGPDEFADPWLHDYKNGKLLISDTSTKKLYIYSVDKDLKFQQIKQTIVTSVMDAKLMDEKDMVLIARMPIKDSPSPAAYVLFVLDITRGSRGYLIPFELQLGENEKPVDFDKLKKTNPWDFPDWMILPAWKYCDYYGDNVYFVWTANLDIIKIDLTTKAHTRFSRKTEKYIQPKVSREFKKAYNEHNSKEYRSWVQKMSWVCKVFADSDIVGIVYTNFDNKTSRWNSFIQIYDHNGTFLKEAPLENFSSTYDRPDIYYDKASRILYCLSEDTVGAESFYTVYKYRLH
ncbi:MAG: hypothetical protein WBK32_09060 [Candidatus Saccharicenans sp.]|jgi:hypothetical protein